tara:strand:+ start:159 stop:281 length:123 start_codon:yes stop_codon:yes gene_type:complete
MKKPFWKTKANPITMFIDLSPEASEKLKAKYKRYYDKKTK